MGIRIGVVGAGSWGTALALLLARKGYETVLWAYERECVDGIRQFGENRMFLPGFPFPATLTATNDLAEAVGGADLVVAVSPSHTVRQVMIRAREFLPRVPIVCASKGIENDTLMTMSEVLEEVLPREYHPHLAYLSGPSFAREVAQEFPTAVTVASRCEETAQRAQEVFTAPYFRVYTSDDVVGVELGGSIKNVMAIGAGVADGLGYGHNTRAALITRGLHEMARLAMRRGAHELTMAGLAGAGDLVLTCTGDLSRNRGVGLRLGRGEKLKTILSEMKMVAEGVKTAKSVHDLARRERVEMPIAEQVYRILYEDKDPREAVFELMGRLPRAERDHY
jgi:glycerol-3-phosphate dehydrogenase (NAD(P)+)